MTGELGIDIERDVDVPMRDGIKLRANLFRPAHGRPAPGLLLRTPYGKPDPEDGYARYVRAGYAVVTQDSRGRYASQGDYVPFTEPHTGDAEDGYDSVEWLAAQPWCDGSVGTFGASYNAWMQWQLAKLQPPHLKAMVAYTIPLELTAVDWPGAFRPGRRIKWWLATMAPDLRKRAGWSPPHTPAEARALWDEVAGAGHWIGYLPWTDFPRHLPSPFREYCEGWLAEPNRTPWGFDQVHEQVTVPNLDFSGWYDHCNDSMRHLRLMQTRGGSEAARRSQLVAGPWNHPGLGQRRIGGLDFGPQAQLDLTDLILRWFDHWLKGVDNGADAAPAVRYFAMSGAGGSWRTADTWPPADTTPAEYRLVTQGDSRFAADGGWLLAGSPPALDGRVAGQAGPVADRFVHDPHNPVPTLWTKEWFTGPADRRRLEDRQDILCYRTSPLAEPVEIAGYPEALLHVSTTGGDADVFARLVDEHPQVAGDDGSQAPGPALEVCYGMVRLRHRHGLDRDDPVTPGDIVEVRVELGPTACRFEAGHRIRLEITSSDFPNHDRNHGTGGDDLAETEMVVTTNAVHLGLEHPSRLVLPRRD